MPRRRRRRYPARAVGQGSRPTAAHRRHRLGAPRQVDGAADGLVTGELEGDQPGDAGQGDPRKLAHRFDAEHEEGSALGAGRRRQADPERDDSRRGASLGLVASRFRGRAGRLGRGMHDDRCAASALQRQRPTEVARHGGDEGIDSSAFECPPAQLRLQQRCLALELAASFDDEPDDTALERDGVGTGDADRRDCGGPERGCRGGKRRDGPRAGLALHQHGPGDRYRGERRDELPQLGRPRRDDRQRRGRDDDQVAGLQRVECRNAGAHHAHPRNRPVRRRAAALGACRAGQELLGEHAEVGHPVGAGPAPEAGDRRSRATTRASTRLPNSRSKSTWRSARPTRSSRPSVQILAHTRRRGR